MARRASVAALLAALTLGACAEPQTPPPSPPSRDNERPRDALPDAYKHPPR